VSLTYRAPAGAGESDAHTDTYLGRFVRLVPDALVVDELELASGDAAVRGTMTITTTLAAPGVRPADNELGSSEALDRLAALIAP
jgi:hypothetical protein